MRENAELASNLAARLVAEDEQPRQPSSASSLLIPRPEPISTSASDDPAAPSESARSATAHLLRSRLPRNIRPRGLAPGCAGATARPLGAWPASRHDRGPGGTWVDPRPQRRRACDREAGDHRLREPAACRRSTGHGDRSGAGAPSRRRPPLREARRPVAWFRLRRPQGRSQAGRGAQGAGPDRSRLLPGGAARIRRAPWPLMFWASCGLDNRGISGLELALDKKLSGRNGRQTIVATRPDERSTCSLPCSRSKAETSG